MTDQLTVETIVEAPLEKVWKDFTDPVAILQWNQASEDWHTTQAINDVRTGGAFSFRMEARDGSEGFDFVGVYDVVEPQKHIAYTMSDGRSVNVYFIEEGTGVRVVETFDPETENTHDMQRSGWQAILDNFKAYAERT